MNVLGSGIDIILTTPRQSYDPKVILDVMADYWPHGVFQDASEVATSPLTSALAEEVDLKSQEFFIYQDEASAASWAACGKTAENANRMVHFLIQDDPSTAENLQITMVIDEWEPGMIRMYASIDERLGFYLPAGPPPNPSPRLNFDAELRAAGCPLNREQFYEAVERIRGAIYPEWTQDELVCHPHEALRFCEIVRSKIQASIPDRLIMKAMLNYRKRRAN